MNPVSINKNKYLSWPFWVLELNPFASNSDIEKAAREIASRIHLKMPDAQYYQTPDGLCKRDSFDIRDAKSALQDPTSRLIAEYWYIPPEQISTEQVKKTYKSNERQTERLKVPIHKERHLEALARSLKVWLW